MASTETPPTPPPVPSFTAAEVLATGCVIPAHPLALNAQRKLDEPRQRALSRYYLAAGAGGLAVGVHTTQFAIHDPQVGLLRPILGLATEEMDRFEAETNKPLVRVAGLCGPTKQAVTEAALAQELGYQYGLLNLGASGCNSVAELITHTQHVAEAIDLFGFYLQPAVGGIDLPMGFWHRFCEIPQARAIKVAAFDRYKTITVVRAVAESGRDDIALYTGNDDSIIFDLLSAYQFELHGRPVTRRFVGGLLGQWAVGTQAAVALLQQCHNIVRSGSPIPAALLQQANALTDMNAVIFDVDHNFRGCIPGIHEILRRQGLLEGNWCLDAEEALSPGQAQEIDRVVGAYPSLSDDNFVAQHHREWLSR